MNKAQEIVIPLREIPGVIQSLKKPINIDEIILCFLFTGLKNRMKLKLNLE